MRISERVGQGSELRECLDALPRAAEHPERFVPRQQQRHPFLCGRRERQRQIHHAEHLFRRVSAERGLGRAEREARGPLGIAGGERMPRDEGEHRVRRIAVGGEEIDQRAVDRPPPRGGQERRREVTDLLVREGVVRRGDRRPFDQKAGSDRGRERLREGRGVAGRITQRALHGLEVAQAEAAAKDRGLCQQRPGGRRQPGRTTVDERAHRARHEPLRARGEGPRAVDPLQHPVRAVRLRDLLDDEWDALGLGVDRGGAGGTDVTTKGPAQQLSGLDLCEAREAQAPHQPEPFHVREERRRLGHTRWRVRAHRENEKDRAGGGGPNEIPKQPDAVLIGPLEIVDEQRQRAGGGRLAQGHRAEVEDAQELAVRAERLQPGFVVAGDRVHGARERLGRGRILGVSESRAGENAPSNEEWAADLLVGRHRGHDPAVGGCELGGGEEQPRLADPRLALQHHTREPAGHGAKRVLDSADLRRTADQ